MQTTRTSKPQNKQPTQNLYTPQPTITQTKRHKRQENNNPTITNLNQNTKQLIQHKHQQSKHQIQLTI